METDTLQYGSAWIVIEGGIVKDYMAPVDLKLFRIRRILNFGILSQKLEHCFHVRERAFDLPVHETQKVQRHEHL